MKWRRPLRYLIVALGLGFAVALVALRRPAPAVTAPSPGVSGDPAAIAESSGGRLVRSQGGSVRFIIDHKGQRSYPDGRAQFLSAHVIFPSSGRELRADSIETRGQLGDASTPMFLVLKGNISLVQGENMDVRADEGTYDDAGGLLDLPGAVTFRRGNLSGSGVGATYARETDLFQLLDQAQATLAGGDATAAMTLTSRQMSFTTAQSYLQLVGEARIVRALETLTGDEATMTFGEDTTTVKFLELRGHAAVTPTDEASTVPAMAATDITMGFLEPGGTLEHATLTGAASIRFREAAGERSVSASWLDLFLGPDGQTVTRLDGRDRVVVILPASADAPAREIRSTLLTARGTPEAGLQSARFERDVTFVERRTARGGRPAEERTGVAQVLTLALDGGFESVRDATFERAVVFTTPASKAEADRAVYNAAGGGLRLERSGQERSARRPRASRLDGSFTVDADRIDLSIDTEDLVATTNVSSQMRTTEKAGARGSAMFEPGKPIYGSADRLEYTKASSTATYTGTAEQPARLSQGDNRVAATTVVLEEQTNNLRATTAVESTFVEAPTEAAPEPRRSNISAAALVYDEAAGTATYTGGVVFRSADAEIESAQLVLTLGANRTVTSFEAAGPAVFAKLAGGHEATGTRLSYDSRTKMYTLHGKPARARSPNETEGDCLLTIGPQVSLAPGRTAQWQPVTGVVESRKVSCTGSIR